ncbi:hypothetical protein DXG01_016826 [Tephrocybe rancida]|nr:hypothetical protein DXG01_016826 [Tephrocybe rancida]
MAPVELPFDVLSIILDILIDIDKEKDGGGTHRDNQALTAYGLAFSEHLPRIQQYLFFDITLRHGDSPKLASILVGSPHLTAYIKRLNIQAVFDDCEQLATILNSVTDLQHLGLEYPVSRRRLRRAPKSLTAALFSRLLTVPSIQCNRIVPPMWFIRSCTQLKELRLSTPPDSLDLQHNLPNVRAYLPDAQCRSSCCLEHLEVEDCSRFIVESLTLSSWHLLKKLVVTNVPLPFIAPLLAEARMSLETFEFSGQDQPAKLDVDGVDRRILNLPHLKSMYFAIYGLDQDASELPLGYLVHILESGSSLRPRALQAVSLVLFLRTARSAAMFNTWERVDAALALPRYTKFRKLSLKLIAMDLEEDNSALRTNFHQALPLLSSTNKLELDF